MKKTRLLLLALLIFSSQSLMAQSEKHRYLEEVFDEIIIQENVLYGTNAAIPFAASGEATAQSLVCDIYSPQDDTSSDRPLVILVHSGSFLPALYNGGCKGTQKDADVVEMAKTLARRGFVAACIDYRLGWDPTNFDHEARNYSLIHAIYRGIQDLNTAVKYFRKSEAEQNNPYGIDPDKIATIGFDTGGSITYGAATLHDAIEDTWKPPFLNAEGPYIIPQIHGDVNADNLGIVPPGVLLQYPAGDTLCYPNHTGYNARTQLAINLNGMIASEEWVTSDDTPVIAINTVNDYSENCIKLPGIPPLPLFIMFGDCDVMPFAHDAGINTIYNNAGFKDVYTQAANANNDGIDGLYKILKTNESIFSPWSYDYSAEPYGVADSDCPTWTPQVQSYRDTIMEYIIPRTCLALDLGCDLSDYYINEDSVGTTTTNTIQDSTNVPPAIFMDVKKDDFATIPNPAINQMLLQTDQLMQSVLLFDRQGQIIEAHHGINNTEFVLHRKNLPTGFFIVMVRFEDGYVAKKITFR